MGLEPAHVLIAANPKSGATSGRARVEQLQQQLTQRGLHSAICYSLPELQQRSVGLHAAGQLRCVVSAGGDGTAAAVVNLVPSGVPLVLLPLGTENLLARYLGARCDTAAVVEAVLHGTRRQLDVGSAGGRIFLLMLGCGFDAEVVRQLHAARTGHIRRWTYCKPILSAMRNYPYPLIDVEILDDQPQRYSVAWLFAFNLPQYAAGLSFCPQADGGDGWLDLCSFRQAGAWRGLYYLSCLWFKRHQKLIDFQHRRARRFRLSSAGQVPYQVDGDPGGMLPLEVEILPGRLHVLVAPQT
jgi:diacylglycerol kinase (ATP)